MSSIVSCRGQFQNIIRPAYLLYRTCFQHFLNTAEWMKKITFERCEKLCAPFQKTHVAKWHRRTQPRFYFAKGNGVKNATIKIIFIVEKLQFLASLNSHFSVFLRGISLSLTQVVVLKMNCLNWCQKLHRPLPWIYSLYLEDMLAFDIQLSPGSATHGTASHLWAYQIRNGGEENVFSQLLITDTALTGPAKYKTRPACYPVWPEFHK